MAKKKNETPVKKEKKVSKSPVINETTKKDKTNNRKWTEELYVNVLRDLGVKNIGPKVDLPTLLVDTLTKRNKAGTDIMAIVNKLHDEATKSLNENKATKTEKPKKPEVKAKPKKTEDVTATGFSKAGSNGRIIIDLVKASGKKGLTMDEIVKASEKAKVKSGNLKYRVRQVVLEGTKPSGKYGGFFKIVKDKYVAI